MFPLMYFIDCNGDMWIPCHCGGGENGATGSEPPAAGAEALPMPMWQESAKPQAIT